MVTASLVKELREKTGAGMLDCKKALEATNADIEAAMRMVEGTARSMGITIVDWFIVDYLCGRNYPFVPQGGKFNGKIW